MAKPSSHYLGLQGTPPVPRSIAYLPKTEEKEFAGDSQVSLVSEIPYEVWLGCLPILPLYTNGK